MILEVVCLGKIKKFNEWCEGCDKRYSRDFYCYQPTLIYSPQTKPYEKDIKILKEDSLKNEEIKDKTGDEIIKFLRSWGILHKELIKVFNEEEK